MGQFDDSLEISQIHYESIYGINGPATKRSHQRMLDIDAAVTYQQRMASMPKCPTCGSMSVVKMGAFERGMSIAFGGIFSNKINKTFRCNQCGYTW